MNIYSDIKEGKDFHKIKILGLTIYKKERKFDYIKRKYLGGIFKVVRKDNIVKYYFLGVKVFKYANKYKKIKGIINSRMACIEDNISMMFAINKLHGNLFPQFKNKHYGQTAVLTATGPSLLHYTPLKNCKYLGVNNSYLKITPDYWFAIDGQNLTEHFEELGKTEFTKFYGQCITSVKRHGYINKSENLRYHIPDCVIEKSNNGHKFYFSHPSLEINRDIETQALPDLGSCVFPAMYFALYAGFKKIYIVGCDCSNNGYFNNDIQSERWQKGKIQQILLRGWYTFKDYYEIFNPDVELISINPVGLKGMFRDVYTKSYIEANPELKEELGTITYLEDIEECQNNEQKEILGIN